MGGPLIERLLEASPQVVDSLKYLIVQPQSDVASVRHYLYAIGWHITAEKMVLDRHRLYEVIFAEPGRETMPEPWLLDVGPYNWKHRHELIPRLIEILMEKTGSYIKAYRRAMAMCLCVLMRCVAIWIDWRNYYVSTTQENNEPYGYICAPSPCRSVG